MVRQFKNKINVEDNMTTISRILATVINIKTIHLTHY